MITQVLNLNVNLQKIYSLEQENHFDFLNKLYPLEKNNKKLSEIRNKRTYICFA